MGCIMLLRNPFNQYPRFYLSVMEHRQKDTVRIAKYLCKSGVKAAAYNAGVCIIHCRYGMNISCCRAKTLVEYFGEDFSHQKCLLCDVCTNGPPQRQNQKEEACILLQTIGTHNARRYSMDSSYNDDIHFNSKDIRLGERPSLMTLVRSIREQFQIFLTTLIYCGGEALVEFWKLKDISGNERIRPMFR